MDTNSESSYSTVDPTATACEGGGFLCLISKLVD